MTTYLLHGLIGAFIVFSLLWIVQVLRRDAGVVDVGWTSGVGAMAIYLAVVGDGWWPRRAVVAFMAGVWAFRLVTYIIKDRLLADDEDGRYAHLRRYWGRHANAWFYVFFTSQSLLVVLFALPFVPTALGGVAGWRVWDVLAVLVWATAMGGEWLADYQLTRWRRDPAHRGQTCRAGLWRYSRHPNYFFEWLHWFAYVLIAVGAPLAGLTWLGPIAMFVFLMRLSGIPYVEKQALRSRGDDYRRYQQTTSMFFPWPPRAAPTEGV